ncbi:hypothetical protein TrLO_g9717 [Triparma laevis f. longispina]|uniref:25S rRNA (uridine-N(3))-methyltransferase BMT5-like domain-containing protein n=1 Tax=Triparma laevis f. longispina TaxID=1714387 RepID=A0A9W7DXT8_9STRA|nr:hypothetical protein TrLO_g9717 [Triparma laevis f. longispina]
MPALTTLIVGDGDLSYAAYLACGKQMPTLTCSVFEADEDALLAVYPTAADHLESLRSNPNVEVSECHNPVGFRGTEESFKVEGARSYICKREKEDNTNYEPTGTGQLEPPHFTFNLSFFASDLWVSFEQDFLEAVENVGESEATCISLTLVEADYVDSVTGKKARKYRVEITANERTALPRAKAVQLLEQVKDCAVAIEGGERRG